MSGVPRGGPTATGADHQPLLGLPTRTLDCGGVCHGTMTGWFNHRFAGSALTIEYGTRPPQRRMRVEGPRQVVELLGGGWHEWL